MGKQNQQSSGVVMHCRRNGVVGPVLVCGGCGRAVSPTPARASSCGMEQRRTPHRYSRTSGSVAGCWRRGSDALDSMPLSAWLVYLGNSCRLKWMRAGKLAVVLGSVG